MNINIVRPRCQITIKLLVENIYCKTLFCILYILAVRCYKMIYINIVYCMHYKHLHVLLKIDFVHTVTWSILLWCLIYFDVNITTFSILLLINLNMFLMSFAQIIIQLRFNWYLKTNLMPLEVLHCNYYGFILKTKAK